MSPRRAALAMAGALLTTAWGAGAVADVDGAETDEACQLQLRAGDKKSSEAVEDFSFGPDAQGKNMWTQPTWGDVFLEWHSNQSSHCDLDTKGTCSIGSCSESRGPTTCSDKNKCLCQEGHCARDGVCVPEMKPDSCVPETGGHCAMFSCAPSRGKTNCTVSNGHSNCLCQPGHCAWKGKCVPLSDTGGSCMMLECSVSRGPTTCHKGRCYCQEGYVAVDGKCKKDE